MKVSVNLYSQKNGEINRFLSSFYNTNFDIERTAFTASNGIKLSVKVKNTGNVKGKEVVQVYVNPAQGRLGKPVWKYKE